MIAVTLKGLARRKTRALLTAFAIVIGVSMVAGTFILTDTTQQAGYSEAAKTTQTTDAAIYEQQVVKNSSSGSGATVPAALLDRVRALPGVADATGELVPHATASVADIIGRDGRPVARQGLARGIDTSKPDLTSANGGAYGPLKLETGAWAKGTGQVVVDKHTAATQHYKLGDAIVISTLGKRHTFKVTGTVSYSFDNLPPLPSLAVWDIPTTQKLFHQPGRFDVISIDAKPGTSGAELERVVRPILPADLQVKSQAASYAESANRWDHTIATIRAFLLAFGGIALLIGAFVIFNTLSITVAQRTRELATLRTLGASRKQVMRSVVIEGLVLGVVASAIGLVVGYGIAKGMLALVQGMNLGLQKGATIVEPRTVVIAMAMGIFITLLASILPARRATRVPPIAAVREGATLPVARLARHSHKAGFVVAGLALLAIAVGVFGGGSGIAVALAFSIGTTGLFTGIALLAPRYINALVRFAGWPARRIGGAAGQVAAANVVRNPGRTASTAATLMIGLTLMTLVAVIGASITRATSGAVTDQIHAGYVVSPKEDQPFAAASGDKLAKVPGVTAFTHVRSEKALVQGVEREVSGIDPATIARFYRFDWSTGSALTLTRLGRDGALVTERYAKDNRLTVGNSLAVTTPSGAKGKLVVRGIYHAPAAAPLLADVNISRQAFDAAFRDPKNSLTFLDADARTAAALKSATARLTGVRVDSAPAYAKQRTKETSTVVAVLYVLLGFSIIVSLMGMVNTMVLSVFERTRELGMLRAVGMTRRQARRMIRHESVITALIGAMLGVGLGVFLGIAVTAAAGEHMALTFPWLALAGLSAVAVFAGIGAAVLPARRASRLNVLDAVAYE